jgi:hypothetical protein
MSTPGTVRRRDVIRSGPGRGRAGLGARAGARLPDARRSLALASLSLPSEVAGSVAGAKLCAVLGSVSLPREVAGAVADAVAGAKLCAALGNVPLPIESCAGLTSAAGSLPR